MFGTPERVLAPSFKKRLAYALRFIGDMVPMVRLFSVISYLIDCLQTHVN